MSHAEALEPFAVKSYRYLRLAIVVVVLSLLASVLIERSRSTCWQGSISAYFYTPAQSVFVGALVAIGAILIAIKGSTDAEDVLLNFAGALAPIVAFVPTRPPAHSCSSVEVIARDPKPFIDNNVLAFAIGGAVSLFIAYVVAKVLDKPMRGRLDRSTLIGLGIGVAFVGAAVIWYFKFRETFLDHAHGGAATVMFAVVGVVMVFNARSDKAAKRVRILYACLAGSMVLSAAGVAIGKRIEPGWDHSVLWLEILELSAFAVFWLAQTLQHWEGGVPTGADRART
jgi:hypothetical protein